MNKKLLLELLKPIIPAILIFLITRENSNINGTSAVLGYLFGLILGKLS